MKVLKFLGIQPNYTPSFRGRTNPRIRERSRDRELNFHKNRQVKEAIERAGARLLFLPPYSPDLSPIELMWSKLKHYLKKKAARTMGDFHQALLEAFETLTDYDFEAWFDECGYVGS